MSKHPHFPHPRILDRVAAALHHQPPEPPVRGEPVLPEGWNWKTPEQWEAEHDGRTR